MLNPNLKNYRYERNLLWPAYDVKCAKVIFDMKQDLDQVTPYLNRGRRSVVQAGGNCGVWPRALAPIFETVHTFEPDPLNFGALVFNTMEYQNVFRYQAALSNGRGGVQMKLDAHELDNCGAAYIEQGGKIRTLMIDDLGLRDCDLIYLDIEGHELPALYGAAHTISESSPVIVIEDKGLSEKFAIKTGEAALWLQQQFGYVAVKHVHKDVILVRP